MKIRSIAPAQIVAADFSPGAGNMRRNKHDDYFNRVFYTF